MMDRIKQWLFEESADGSTKESLIIISAIIVTSIISTLVTLYFLGA